jgi:hypothetical protein
MSPVPYLLGVRSFSELAWNRCTSRRLRFFRPRRKGFLIWLPHTPFYINHRYPQKSSPEREIAGRQVWAISSEPPLTAL